MLTRPSPLPNLAFTSNPAPSSMTLTLRPASPPLKVHDDFPRAAVPQGVLQRLLHDTVQAQRDVMRQRVRHVLVSDRDRHVGPGELLLKAGKCRGEAEQPELDRVEAVRQVVDALGQPVSAAQGRAAKPLAEVGGLLQIGHDESDLLADVVVQLPGDPRPLVLLRLDQAAAQI